MRGSLQDSVGVKLECRGQLRGFECLKALWLEVGGARCPCISTVQAKQVEVVIILRSAQYVMSLSTGSAYVELTLSLLSPGMGSRVAVMKSSTVPSAKKQFI